jgi:hypothetical protein
VQRFGLRIGLRCHYGARLFVQNRVSKPRYEANHQTIAAQGREHGRLSCVVLYARMAAFAAGRGSRLLFSLLFEESN